MPGVEDETVISSRRLASSPFALCTYRGAAHRAEADAEVAAKVVARIGPRTRGGSLCRLVFADPMRWELP
ncbi:MAG: hypothetical protein ACREU3_00945 [Steroidobacteraceae bacterium]